MRTPRTHTRAHAGVCAPRETLDALQFGEAAGRLTLAPTRRTEVRAHVYVQQSIWARLMRAIPGREL